MKTMTPMIAAKEYGGEGRVREAGMK